MGATLICAEEPKAQMGRDPGERYDFCKTISLFNLAKNEMAQEYFPLSCDMNRVKFLFSIVQTIIQFCKNKRFYEFQSTSFLVFGFAQI